MYRVSGLLAGPIVLGASWALASVALMMLFILWRPVHFRDMASHANA